ncbi:MAG: hypothetical protein PHI32_11745 [Dysgonamonadaceae bacterium]|nr:hypothetical protein [Dysgonamonadaceae bacterium]
MAEEYWKDSPFGKDSIFAPGWDEKQKEEREKRDKKSESNILSSNNGIEIIKNKEQKADGYYYTQDGIFYGKEGTSDLISICSKVESINGQNRYFILYKTNIQYENLILVAGTAIGESSYGYGVENKLEVYAIANAIMNFYRYEYKSNGTIRSSITKMKAFAAINQNDVYKKFISYSDKKRNDTFFKEAICAALNALYDESCIDYSNGATHWDGIDIKQKGRKWQEGLKFQTPSADIFSIGDNKKSVKQKYGDGKYYERIYDYKWIGTRGFYGINEKKKNPYFPYFEGDKENTNKFGTVLMRLSDDYKNRLKYGDKKVE